MIFWYVEDCELHAKAAYAHFGQVDLLNTRTHSYLFFSISPYSCICSLLRGNQPQRDTHNSYSSYISFLLFFSPVMSVHLIVVPRV